MANNKEYKGYIGGINGPVVYVKGNPGLKMLEMVFVGKNRLIGEVISVEKDKAIVQVYEATSGLKIGDFVESSGAPLSVTLGPGIIGEIFDGIQRPLKKIEEISGYSIKKGLNIKTLDEEKLWKTKILIKDGDLAIGGQIIAEVQETPAIMHKIMVPPGIKGVFKNVCADGEYTILKKLADVEIENKKEINLFMTQKWPVKRPRPFNKRRPIHMPLITGQRVIDMLFPIAKGGTAAIPGGFGTGKTMTQHQFAKWSDADIVVYIGCGERGNEIADVLESFPNLKDPKTGKSLMNRTVLIANTSNMPVAAREASIYTGITIAEYYRDMGYHVALMADSTSRWAEALREISGRLEEMPAEEGYPAYLPSRLSQFYERAGYIETLCGTEGSISIIGAVSPQSNDFSEPVTQNTKRFTRCFWALDKSLAYSRHYPAINWTESYSEYIDELAAWYEENTDRYFLKNRIEILRILHEESRLMEIVKLIGQDVLPDSQKLTLEMAKIIRQGFLQQNAFHENDTFVPVEKQYKMMSIILMLNEKSQLLVNSGIPISVLSDTGIFGELIQMKYTIPNDNLEGFGELEKKIDKFYSDLSIEYKNAERRGS
ncbi:MAG: V-type ATP synthase subunit A [Clostridiales bacterium]|nr:V-type ATP synthase subunit A [Clostridiales bacterium]